MPRSSLQWSCPTPVPTASLRCAMRPSATAALWWFWAMRPSPLFSKALTLTPQRCGKYRAATRSPGSKACIRQITSPHAQITHPHARITHPRARITYPHAQITHPHARISRSHARIARSHARITSSHARIARSHARITSSHARITSSHARIARPHATTLECVLKQLDRLAQHWSGESAFEAASLATHKASKRNQSQNDFFWDSSSLRCAAVACAAAATGTAATATGTAATAAAQ